MPGILDFMTDVSADSTLAADFAKKASEDCTAADLKDFFQTHGYPDVTDGDVEKILYPNAGRLSACGLSLNAGT